MIPEDWDLVILGRHSEITKLAGFEYSSHFNSYKDNGDIVVIRGTNITHNSLDLSDVKTIPKSTSDKLPRSKLKTGDLVFAYVGTIGPVFLIDKDNRYHLGPNTARITCKHGLVPRFLFCYFLGDLIRKEIIEKISTGAQPSLSMTKIRAFHILKPTKTEQEAIAEALTDADALIASLEQLLTKKCLIKRGAMQELLTGKKRLPGFSGEWEVRTFGEIFQYYGTANNSRSDLLAEGDTFYIHYGEIHTKFHNHLDFSVVRPPRINRRQCPSAALLKNGDWVMADVSEDYEGVGKSIEIQGLSTNTAAVAGLHTFLLREKNQTFSPGFKGHLGNLESLHEQFLRVATGMKVFGVSKAALKEIELPIPQPEEQRAIATILSDMDSEITVLEAKLYKARQIKQGMMQELLTGRVRLV